MVIEYTSSFYISESSNISVYSLYEGLTSSTYNTQYNLSFNSPIISYTSSGIIDYTITTPIFNTLSYLLLFDTDYIIIDSHYSFGISTYYYYDSIETLPIVYTGQFIPLQYGQNIQLFTINKIDNTTNVSEYDTLTYNKITFNISPEQGQYSDNQYVTLSLSYNTPSVSIYYNLNNSDNYSLYTTPILLSNVILYEDDLYNLKVKLVDNNISNHSSSVYEYNYIISLLPHVLFNVSNPNDSYILYDGSYNGYAVATLSSTTNDTIIYYTTNSSVPTTLSMVYNGLSFKYIVPGNLTNSASILIKTLSVKGVSNIYLSCSFRVIPKQIRIAQYDAGTFAGGSWVFSSGFNYTSSRIEFASSSKNITALLGLYTFGGSVRYPVSKYVTIYNKTYAQNSGYLKLYEINTQSLYISFSLIGYLFAPQTITNADGSAYYTIFAGTLGGHGATCRNYCIQSAGTSSFGNYIIEGKHFALCQPPTVYTQIQNISMGGFVDSSVKKFNTYMIYGYGANAYRRLITDNISVPNPTRMNIDAIGVSA